MSNSGTGLIKKLSSLESSYILLFDFKVFNILSLIIESLLTEWFKPNNLQVLLYWFWLCKVLLNKLILCLFLSVDKLTKLEAL